MSSSRKLLVAALLIGGGYGAAFVLGRGSELVSSPGSSQNGTAPDGGWFAGFRSAVAGDNHSPNIGQLVPEAPGHASQGGPAFAADRQPDAPIWLTATTESKAALAVATQPRPAESPAIGFLEPPPEIPPLPSRAVVDAPPTAPKARITNVVAADSDATRREASPWDRWPRWNSDDVASSQGAVAATFQQSPAATAGMVPVTFSAAVIARNTPARDTGPETAATGRTHIVVDGDSLEKLAERYLDDPTLDDEIYRLNREVLASPELLPIGVELQIPDDRMAAAEVSRTASNMVPVEWTPRPFDGPPRAELLPPIPAGQSD